MMNELPKVGEKYYDCENRELAVNEIDVGNFLGREIIGILNSGSETNNYSCNLKIWKEIWLEKIPRIDPSKMKI